MSQREIITGVLVNGDITFTFGEVCQTCQLSEELLMDLMGHGLLGELSLSPKEIQFDNDMLARIRAAHRLQHDLELNLQGVILALELLDEMSKMRDELDVLRRHVLL